MLLHLDYTIFSQATGALAFCLNIFNLLCKYGQLKSVHFDLSKNGVITIIVLFFVCFMKFALHSHFDDFLLWSSIFRLLKWTCVHSVIHYYCTLIPLSQESIASLVSESFLWSHNKANIIAWGRISLLYSIPLSSITILQSHYGQEFLWQGIKRYKFSVFLLKLECYLFFPSLCNRTVLLFKRELIYMNRIFCVVFSFFFFC